MRPRNPFSAGSPDDWQTYRRYPYLLARLTFFLVLIGLAYWVTLQAAGVVSLVFASAVIAYVLDPLVGRLQRFRIPRVASILLLMLLGVSFGVIFTVWMVPTITREFAEVARRLEAILRQDPLVMRAWLESTFGFTLSPEIVDEGRRRLQEALPSIVGYVGELLQGAAARTMGAIGWVLNVVMIPIFAFYFLRDFNEMKRWVADQLPLASREAVLTRARRIDGVVGDWLRGQVQVALLLSAIYATGLAIVGVPIAIPIGILAGLLSVVPYLGFVFGFGLAMLMALLDWQGLGQLLAVAGVFTGAQLLEGYVLTPKIVGEKVGLSPVAVIIVLLLGGELFGFLGFMLSVPVAGAMKTVLLEVLDWYRTSEVYLGPTGETAAEAETAAAAATAPDSDTPVRGPI
jgi:predicted PurR-regulated permease PerM